MRTRECKGPCGRPQGNIFVIVSFKPIACISVVTVWLPVTEVDSSDSQAPHPDLMRLLAYAGGPTCQYLVKLWYNTAWPVMKTLVDHATAELVPLH